MFFKDFLLKIKERNRKRIIIRSLIANLKIDEIQKNLYYESLEILEDDMLDSFYEKLNSIIGKIEQEIILTTSSEERNKLHSIKELEKEDRTKEFGSFNIILDNI